MKRAWLYFVCQLLGVIMIHGQQTAASTPPSQRKLAFVISGLLTDAFQGIDPQQQSLLGSVINPSFASLNSGVAAQLSNLPLPSPASGIRLTFDPQVGVYVPSAQSLGPILAERAETIGKNKFFFAVAYQRFQFDRLDQLDLRNFEVGIPFNFPAGTLASGAVPGFIRASASTGLNVSQATAHFTYGVTDWFDVSYAFSVVTSSLNVSAEGTVRELLRGQTLVTIPQRSVEATSTGLGDGIARIKATVLRRPRANIAVAADLRIPIGDEFNYHGAGAYGLKPFLIASINSKTFSPHLNAGYQWNGSSFLASPTATQKGRLPGQAFVTGGMDAAVSSRVTFSTDFIDQIVLNGQRTFVQKMQASDGSSFNTINFPTKTRQECNLAVGLKARLLPDLVLTGNVLFRLNDSGLRARAVPMVGLSYLF